MDPTEAVARSITAIAALATLPWKDFFDRTSLVDAALRRDPAGVYAGMDFESRDLYRKAVEDLGRGSGRVETEVVRLALEMSDAQPDDARRGHVGHWLIGSGRAELEGALGYRPPFASRHLRWIRSRARPLYFAMLVLFCLAALLLPVGILWNRGAGPAAYVGGILLSLVPAGILAVTLTHWLVTLILPPRTLPKLDFEAGLPEGVRAAVAIPVIFRSAAEVGPLLEHVETNWLTNPDPNLRFVVLSDFADAAEHTLPSDADPRRAARRDRPSERPLPRPPALRAPPPPTARNAADGIWMGWERKRGKLSEFNDFLATGNGAAFPVRAGDAESLIGTPSVITTDADTILPPGAAHRLLGALLHPLNRAEFGSRRPGDGRLHLHPAAGRDRAPGGCAVAVHPALHRRYRDRHLQPRGLGRVPGPVRRRHLHRQGRLRRRGLPPGHRRARAREHHPQPRSVRGPARAHRAGQRHRPLRGLPPRLPRLCAAQPPLDSRRLADPALARRDGPRRGGRAPAQPLRSARPLAHRGQPPPQPDRAGARAAGRRGLADAARPGLALDAAHHRRAGRLSLHRPRHESRARAAARHGARPVAGQLDHAGRWALAITFMLYEAAVAVDAIGRSLWRMYVSRRQLLEWTTAAQVAHSGDASAFGYWRAMWVAPASALLLAVLVLLVHPAALAGAAPLLALWFVSPAIAAWIGRPVALPIEELEAGDRAFLRRLARRTWYFFEVFAGPEDNWLPPDNFQADPRPEIAHRTSPTNIGMLMLSMLAARDLGYLGLRNLTIRSRAVLDTMERMERHRGHWLNWYDTRSLHPLEPRYVSTVDSGNLAVSLVTLAEGCRELAESPVFPDALWSGLTDALDLLSEALADLPGEAGDRLRAQMDRIAARAAELAAAPVPSPAALDALRAGEFAALKPLLLEALETSGPADGTRSGDRPGLARAKRASPRDDARRTRRAPALAFAGRGRAGGSRRRPAPPRRAPRPGPAASGRGIARLGGQARCRRGAGRRGCRGPRLARPSRRGACRGRGRAGRSSARHRGVAARAAHAADAMDFAMLYDRERRIFNIGYNLNADQLDPHHYDLLMSEARLASYFAIAKRDVPAEHWFHLGRPIAGSRAS
jgi:cyclic beta-1,2-glucan synthetase